MYRVQGTRHRVLEIDKREMVFLFRDHAMLSVIERNTISGVVLIA